MRDRAAIEADLQTFDSAPSGVAVPAVVRLAGDVPALLAAVTRVRELAEGDEYWYDSKGFRHPHLVWVRDILRALGGPDGD